MAIDQADTPGRELNLAGEVCPYTYVRTKLTLEEMAAGEVLRVLVDHEPAVGNIPRSARMDGHDVLSVRTVGPGRWEIVLRKGEGS